MLTSTTTQPIKLVLADDHQLFVEGVEQIFANSKEFEVLAKAENGKVLMQILNRLKPDLILLDINMPYMTGMEAAQQIKKTVSNVKIVFLSMYYDSKIISLAKQYGVDGFIIKNTTAAELKNALLRVMKGETVYVFANDYLQLSTTEVKDDDFTKRYKISPRELEIIQLVKQGKSTKGIADELSLSVFTIETHRKNIFRKLKIASVGQLISFAVENNV